MNYQAFKRLAWPPTPWVIPGLLTDGRVLIYGQPKGGKSVAATQIAHAVQSGTSLWGFEAPEPRTVLYVQLDAPATTMIDQVAKCGPAFDARFDVPVVHYQHLDLGWRVPPFFLNSPLAREKMAGIIKRVNPGFVVWDGLTFLDYSTDLNKREGVLYVLERLRLLHSGATLIVAHSNKEGKEDARSPIDRLSGSHAIGGSAEQGIYVERDRDEQGNMLPTGTFRIWGRLAELPASLAMRLDVGHGWRRRTPLTARPPLQPATLAALAAASPSVPP